MLHTWALLLFTLQTAGQGAPAATPGPTTQEGPMRVVLTALAEQRVVFTEPGTTQEAPTFLRAQFKLQGAELKNVARIGNVIISEAIDDTGAALIDPNSYDQQKLTESRPIEVNDQIVSQGGPAFVEAFSVSTRGATKLKTLKGKLNVTYASNPIEIVFENPLRYSGQELDHPDLKKYGVRIKLIGPGQEGIPPDDKAIGVLTLEGKDRIHSVEFFDDWMRRMPVRPRELTTADNQSYTAYRTGGGNFTEETQLIIKIFPEIKTVELPIEYHNISLP